MNTAAPVTTNVTTAASTAPVDSFKDALGDVSDLSVDWGAGDAAGEPSNAAPMPDATVQAAPTSEPPAASTQAAPPAPPALDASAQFQAFAQQMQQQQMQWMAQQQQAMAQMIGQLPQMFAGALPKPPEAPKADPFASLDQNDPDYHFNRLGIENKLLQDKIAAMESWRDQFQQQQAAEQQAAQQQHQQAQHQAYVKSEVERSVFGLFKDVPRTPQSEQLFQLACEQMDRSWAQSGYQQTGAAQGWQAAKRLVDTWMPLIRTQAAAAGAPQTQSQPPLGGSRAPTLATQAQVGENPFDALRRTRDADAAEFSAVFNNSN